MLSDKHYALRKDLSSLHLQAVLLDKSDEICNKVTKILSDKVLAR